MKERGMIFNAEMVRAILDGRKTQTRRMLSPRQLSMIDVAASAGECYPLESGEHHASSQSYYRELCPLGAVGDRIWVRETHRVHSRATDIATLVYKASERQSWTQQTHRVPVAQCDKLVSAEKWTPSIHMPRWASRITLEITGVRVERLNSISEEDAMSEGIDADRLAESQDNYDCIADQNMTGRPTAIGHFSDLWQSIYGEEIWQENPWVWVISFKRVEQQP